jgi:hypothetical protein
MTRVQGRIPNNDPNKGFTAAGALIAPMSVNTAVLPPLSEIEHPTCAYEHS